LLHHTLYQKLKTKMGEEQTTLDKFEDEGDKLSSLDDEQDDE
jgi:hypothetical protein